MSCVACGSQRNPPFNFYCADCYVALSNYVRVYGEDLRKYVNTRYNVKLHRFKNKKSFYDYYCFCKRFANFQDLPDFIVLREQMLYNKVSEDRLKKMNGLFKNQRKLHEALNMLNYAAWNSLECFKHEVEITLEQLFRKNSLS